LIFVLLILILFLHRNNMFELADRLVGIYKTNDATKSVTINPKLFEASSRLSAILAQTSPELEEACAEYGQALGTAFQVIDDVLDYEGNAAEMGKNLGDDLREGKATLPLILAMQRGTPDQKALIQQAIETGSVVQLNQVIAIVRETGALDGSRQAAMAEAQRAVDAAQHLPNGPYKDALVALASQLLERRT
jgi:octaprenyl-diphosphate synthase